ncbi:MAG: MauE/DoxX family redox-associated membrane protein [Ignavibacteria bacterium]
MEKSRLPDFKMNMEKLFSNKIFILIVRLVLGGLFVYASMDKMANSSDFAKVIHNYKILPVSLENLLAIFLPWLEFVTGLFLLVGKYNKGALFIYNIFLCIFIIALTQALIRGLDINCGCFSVKPSSTSEVWLRIIEDLVMLFFSFNLYRFTEENNFNESIQTEKS